MKFPRLATLLAYSLGAFLLLGCVTDKAVTRQALAAAVTVAPPPPPAPKPFVLRWECPGEPLDASVLTGIASSTNLRQWQLETRFNLVGYSNVWSDTNTGLAMKFYRAFNE